jgi:hypothetical protein
MRYGVWINYDISQRSCLNKHELEASSKEWREKALRFMDMDR